MYLPRVILKLAALAPAIVALGVALSSLAPLPEAWESPRLTLMMGALLAVSGASYLYLYAQGEREEKRTRALDHRLDTLRASIATLRDANGVTDQVRAQLEVLPKWGRILSRYAGDYMLARIDSILAKEHFEIRGGFFFQDFYREVFNALPPCTLIATADAMPEYMWKSRDLNALFEDFIKRRGGKLDRIFFLRAPEHLHDASVREIMLGQHNAGVNVHWVVRSALPEALYMIAEEGGAFGWQLRINARGEIEHVDVSWNPQVARERHRYLSSVLNHPATQAFRP